jgi:putative Ca2+/H+ antiporter (TMEM165/GDT1 family)
MQDRACCGFIPRRRGCVPRQSGVAPCVQPPIQSASSFGDGEKILEAFLVSAGIVALAEIGDKTQLLALVLAARYRRPAPVILGILAATLANHALAAWLGAGVAAALGPQALRWVLGLSFLAMAAWTLIPDKLEKEKPQSARLDAFAATLLAFFLVEMGDKTQIATAALAARYASIAAVVAGTTLGMMLADVPAVYFGERVLRRVPARTMHRVAAASFALLGFLALLGAG